MEKMEKIGTGKLIKNYFRRTLSPLWMKPSTEYPSHDYRQIDNMIEERKRVREGTPRRDLSKEKYQPRRLVEQRKIDLNLPKTA